MGLNIINMTLTDGSLMDCVDIAAVCESCLLKMH